MSNHSLKILFVGMHYAPEHTGNAPYTTGAAESLASAGHGVTILTGVPHYPEWAVHPEYRRVFRTVEECRGVVVRRLRHYVPRRQSAIRRAWMELTFAVQVLTSQVGFRPDVVVAVIPSLLSALAAKAHARRYGAPLVVWVQDSASEAAGQTGITGGARLSGLLRSIENLVLRSAKDVLAISPHFADLAREAGVADARVHIIRNWTHVQPPTLPRAVVRAQMGWREDEIVALHTGNMGLKQGLENVIAAAAAAEDDAGAAPLRFVLMGGGNQNDMLRDLAKNVKGANIEPPADGSVYTSVLAAADVLLINERPGVMEMSLPSKLTSYLMSGRPVIAAVESEGATAREIRSSGAGVMVPPGDPQALRQAVRALGADARTAAELGRKGRKYAEEVLSARASLSQLRQVLFSTVQPNRVMENHASLAE